jgi:hypothetical protein
LPLPTTRVVTGFGLKGYLNKKQAAGNEMEEAAIACNYHDMQLERR